MVVERLMPAATRPKGTVPTATPTTTRPTPRSWSGEGVSATMTMARKIEATGWLGRGRGGGTAGRGGEGGGDEPADRLPAGERAEVAHDEPAQRREDRSGHRRIEDGAGHVAAVLATSQHEQVARVRGGGEEPEDDAEPRIPAVGTPADG